MDATYLQRVPETYRQVYKDNWRTISKGDIQPNLEKIRTCSFFAWIDCIKYLEPPKSFVKLNSMGKTQGGHALFAQLGKNANSAPEGRRDFSNTPKCAQWSHLCRWYEATYMLKRSVFEIFAKNCFLCTGKAKNWFFTIFLKREHFRAYVAS